MFYDNQPKANQIEYKEMLALIASLSNLFSESDKPYLSYRAHENMFCKAFDAENLARHDCSADARKGEIGIGLKTWVGSDTQKVAEFNKVSDKFKGLSELELVKTVSLYRNERIRITKKLYGIDELLYHVVKRQENTMLIYEAAFDVILIENIVLLPEKSNRNCIYFSDGVHLYNFNKSKNTLYMVFNDMKLLDSIDIIISKEPYALLKNIDIETNEYKTSNNDESIDFDNKLCLKLYSENLKNGKFVPEHSGLNLWNAAGRKRDPNEIYIPYPAEDRQNSIGFFPPRDTHFNLHLPDGKTIVAKVCQDNCKAIMSNPNKELGEWLLRGVFELKEKELLTYEKLEKYNVDSVMFSKIGDLEYKIDFCDLGTYDKYSFYKRCVEVKT